MSAASHDRSGPYVLGIDMGTESVRVGVFDLDGTPLAYEANTYRLRHPRPGWAEQEPDEWWTSLVASVRGAMKRAEVPPESIAGASFDATTCTVVALDDTGQHLRPAIMWMDVRATEEAQRVAASQHPVRAYNGGGPVSAEWYPCKALWLKRHEPEVYRQAHRIVDCTDWIGYRLTGRWTANVNSNSVRAYYNRDLGGWPEDFYAEIGLEDVIEKLPPDVLDLGEPVGGLSAQAAEELGLLPGTPIAQGPGDAWAAQIGLNVVQPGTMALITGSSHVLIGQTDAPTSGRGFFGAYPDAVVPGQYTVEGGQVSTGSVLKWFKDNFQKDVIARAKTEGVDPYHLLNVAGAELPPGSEGLVVLDYWQGNRTPYTDPEARGMMWGFSLHHTPAHVYHAIQEGVCYGTAHIVRVMADAGFAVERFVACGGATNSRTWTQMHADVTGVPVTLTENGDAAVLGAGVLAATGAGLYRSVEEAAGAMVRETETLEPDPDRHEQYRPYVDAYVDTYPQMRELMHSVVRRVGS